MDWFHQYLSSLPEENRLRLEKQLKHSISLYGLDGTHVPHPAERENLLPLLDGRERYIVDSNFPWKSEAAKQENRAKAFIVSQTVTDEPDNLKGVLFGPKTDISNNNLFEFGMVNLNGSFMLMVSRFDSALHSIFDKTALDLESTRRATRKDPEFVERERQHLSEVQGLREYIQWEIVAWPDVNNLPPEEFTTRKKTQLVEIIRSNSASGFRNWLEAAKLASFAYAALLLESDDIGSKTRREFSDPNNRNVFGDTRLVQNALWLGVGILTYDKAVKRMVEYINVPAIKATDSL